MVDENRLAELIVAKTDMNLEEVEERLDVLTQEIQSAGANNEPYKIEGFGTFNHEQDTTRFEADDLFETEINQKYAGMRPIELMGSFKETEPDIPAELVEPIQEIEKPAQPKSKPEPEPVEPEPKPAHADVGQTTEKEKEKEAEPVTKKTKKVQDPSSSDETGVGSIIAIILAIIVAIILSGWLLYNMGVFSSDNTTANSAARNTVMTQNTQAEKASSMDEAKTVSEKTGLNGRDNRTAITKEQSEPLYGLTGSVNPKIDDGYTIVVHSLVQKKHALETLAAIKQQGLRAFMVRATVNGSQYFRLSIGQFKTITDAQKAAKTLSEPYKSNHFIKQL